MKKKILSLIALITILLNFIIPTFPKFVASAESTDIDSIVFRYSNEYSYKNFIFEGELSSLIQLGLSSGDNGGSDRVWIANSGSDASQYIKWNKNDTVCSCLGEEGVTAIADNETHYGVFFVLYTHHEGDVFSPTVKVYLYSDDGNLDVSTLGKTYTNISSDRKKIYVYLDLGLAEDATTINIEKNGGTLSYDHIVNNVIKIKKGTKLSDLTNPKKAKKVFDAWYSNVALTEKFNFENTINVDELTLYAKYVDATAIENVNITFDIPAYGQNIVVDYEHLTQTPQLELNIKSGEPYSILPNDANLNVYWYDFTTGNILDGIELKQDEEYGIMFYLKSDSGYYFDDNVEVKINNSLVTGTAKVGSSTTNRIKLKSDNEKAQICFSFVAPKSFAITLDVNGGQIITNPLQTSALDGTSILLPTISTSNIQSPTNKIFDAYEINGTRYEAGTSYTVTENTTIKILWKNVESTNKTSKLALIIIVIIISIAIIVGLFFLIKHINKKKYKNQIK